MTTAHPSLHRLGHMRRPTGITDTAAQTTTTEHAGARWLAATRIAIGLVFLWAFTDKLVGLGYATPAAGGWVDGGSPTTGFLSHTSGPLAGLFGRLAGSTAVDVIFMVALLGIGLALVAGVARWLTAVSATALLLLMWLAEWPLSANAGSTNPIIDSHVVMALTVIALTVAGADQVWGLGAWWQQTRIVKRFSWLA